MALLLETQVELENGLIVTNPYGRITAIDDYTGSVINGSLILYKDKNAFESKKDMLIIRTITDYIQVSYDRAVDGTDVLDIAHNAFISKLAEQGIVAIKELD